MITSEKTSVNQLPAISGLVDKKYSWQKGSKNLDMGAGKYDRLTEYLSKKGVKSYSFDPYNRSDEENKVALLNRPYDTITISNVLNVIKSRSDRVSLLFLAKELLKEGGRVYITVYAGDSSGIGKVSKTDCWQENRKTESYMEEVLIVFPKVNRYGRLICGEC